MNVSRRSLPWLPLLALLLTLAGIAGCGDGEAPSPAPLEKVRFGLPLQPTSALAIIARDQGLFAAQGIDMTFIPYPSGKRAVVEGLLPGKADLISASEPPLVFAGLAGEAFTIFATLCQADNVNRVIARTDRGIHTPADLRGHRIGTQRGSAVHFFLHLFLLENGLNEESVEVVFLKAEELPTALAEGRIDAFSMREPFITRAKELLGERAVVFQAPGIFVQMEPLVASQALTARPAVMEGILRALLAAEGFLHQHPRQAAEAVGRYLGVAPSAYAHLLDNYEPRLALEQSLLLLLEDEARWALHTGLAAPRAPPNFLTLIDEERLRAVAPERVTILR